MAAQFAYDTAEETWGGPLEALGLAITVLKKTKARSWAELCATEPGTPTAKLLSSIDLSDGQLSVLEFHRDVVDLLRVSPSAIPAICNVCGLPTLVDTSAPAACTMSLRCTGKPIKPAAAKKAEQAPTRPPLVLADEEEDESAGELSEDLDLSGSLDDFEEIPSKKTSTTPAVAEFQEPDEELVDFDEF